MNTGIELNNLSIGYTSSGKVNAVAEHLTAVIPRGELTCLLGANGTGKSTLLKTLANFLPPLEGEIRLDGKPLSSYSDKAISQYISVVLTDRFDLRDMTVTELVGLGRIPYTGFWGVLSSEDNRIVERAIRLVKIEELSERSIHTLSDGERQKAMIAKALAQETPVILLDEPTAFLDFQSKVDILQLLLRLSRETGKTIFLSTHDIELALQIADRLWLMEKGKGITIGTPDSLSSDGTITRFFTTREGISYDPENKQFRIIPTC